MSCPLHVPNGYARMKTQLRPTTSFGGRMEGHGHQYARAAAAGSQRGEGSGEDDPHHAGATGSSADERVERRLFRPGHDYQAVAHPRAGACTGRSRERAGTAGGSVRRQAGAARSAAARGGAGGAERVVNRHRAGSTEQFFTVSESDTDGVARVRGRRRWAESYLAWTSTNHSMFGNGLTNCSLARCVRPTARTILARDRCSSRSVAPPSP